MTMKTAGLSLDLDNLWAYMRIHGEPGWEAFPSYLDVVVPRILGFAEHRGVGLTVFVVGKDATLDDNRQALSSIVEAGHEVGNHSYLHEPWMHRYTPEHAATEIATAHDAIVDATGVTPVGFRGPGFSITPAVLGVLQQLGYRYDSTVLPTYIGPLARWYYFRGTSFSEEETSEREALFGGFTDGFQPNRPFTWQLAEGSIDEFPVTTFPGLKVPFHFSYVLYLSTMSERLAEQYLRAAITACRVAGIGPSLLLHPLDFLDDSDAPQLGFFPAMAEPATDKVRRLDRYVGMLSDEFDVVPMGSHVTRTPRVGKRMIQGI